MAEQIDTTDIQYQKPDTIDSPIYVKPNAYDDDDRNESAVHHLRIKTVIEVYQGDNKRPVSPDLDDDDDDKEGELVVETMKPNSFDSATPPTVTSSVLSEAPSATTQTTITEELAALSLHTSLTSSSIVSPSPSATSSTTTTSTMESNSSKQALLNSLKAKLKTKDPKDTVVYDVRKHSLVQPHQHDIYFHGTKKLAYRKQQSHSYSWGFQNILYRIEQDDLEEKQAAETRRKAFQKDIVVAWADQERELKNKTNSHLLFVYQMEFEDYKLRWKRPSLLSHDMVCQVSLKDQRKQWRVLAEFDSHGMGYLIHVGRLIIDKAGLALFEDRAQLEANLLITCCTMVDLMREVVEKAVGVGNGGVVGSD